MILTDAIAGRKTNQAGEVVSLYKLDGLTGDVIDSVGGFHGTNNGATRGVAGVDGNAFSFNGSQATKVDLPASGVFANSFSIEWYYKSPGGMSSFRMIDSRGTGAAGSVRGFTIGEAGRNILIDGGNGHYITIVNTNWYVLDNEWHKGLLTWNTEIGRARYYGDDVLTSEYIDENLIGLDFNAAFYRLGGSLNNNQYYTGLLDEIKFYNYEL